MPRFYFHTEDGKRCHDDDGSELPDVAAAKRTAVRVLCEMLPDVSDFWQDCSFTVTCTDSDDLTLFRLDVSATVSPVAPGGSARSKASPPATPVRKVL